MLALLFILHLLSQTFSFPNAESFNEEKKPVWLDLDLFIILVTQTKLSTDTRQNKVLHFPPINFSPLHSDKSLCQRFLILST